MTGEVLATTVAYAGNGPAGEVAIEGKTLSIGVTRA